MKKKHPRTKVKRPALRRVLMGLTAGSMLCLTLAQGASPMLESAEAAPSRRARSVVYVSDAAGLKLRQEDAEKIDQINYSFALIENGKATGAHWQGIQTVSAYLRRNPHITGVLAVGGWGADGFSQACATEEGRIQLADSLLALMDEHGFTGIDVDWEYPGSSAAGIASSEDDVENWYKLLTLLREGLDKRTAATGRYHVLSVALGAGDEQLSAVDGSRLDKLVDQAVVMAYDLCGFDKQTGHHAGLYPHDNRKTTGAYAVNSLIAGGLPARKLLLGIPAYGRMWRQVTGGGNGLHQRAGTAGNKWLAFAELQQLEAQGYTRYYDETAQAAWYFNGSSFVSAEDAQSLRYKAQWAIDRSLMGTAVWSYNQDDGSVITALHESLLP